MGPDTLNIAGIDALFGLKSVGGKRERYETLLRKFAGRQAATVVAIRAALSVGDTSTGIGRTCWAGRKRYKNRAESRRDS